MALHSYSRLGRVGTPLVHHAHECPAERATLEPKSLPVGPMHLFPLAGDKTTTVDVGLVNEVSLDARMVPNGVQ